MNRSNWHRLAGVATALALAGFIGYASNAIAQGDTDMSGMPTVQTQGNVSFVSGGIGEDESKALRREAPKWPLSLEFVGPTAEYLADVHVKVARVGGETVFETVSAGPLMLVKLPPGTYKVSAQYKDRVQSRTIQVKGRGAHGAFKWATE